MIGRTNASIGNEEIAHQLGVINISNITSTAESVSTRWGGIQRRLANQTGENNMANRFKVGDILFESKWYLYSYVGVSNSVSPPFDDIYYNVIQLSDIITELNGTALTILPDGRYVVRLIPLIPQPIPSNAAHRTTIYNDVLVDISSGVISKAPQTSGYNHISWECYTASSSPESNIRFIVDSVSLRH